MKKMLLFLCSIFFLFVISFFSVTDAVEQDAKCKDKYIKIDLKQKLPPGLIGCKITFSCTFYTANLPVIISPEVAALMKEKLGDEYSMFAIEYGSEYVFIGKKHSDFVSKLKTNQQVIIWGRAVVVNVKQKDGTIREEGYVIADNIGVPIEKPPSDKSKSKN